MASLFVVATPIGNLGDMSPRAAEALGACPVVAAESLNRARKLLSHLGLKGKRLVSCREANRRRAAAQVAAALEGGADVALISDAGTPGLSDPGSEVVDAVQKAGFRVTPIPGPSALAAALSVAGFKTVPLAFLGFLPAKAGARRKLLESARKKGWATAFYEAPHRMAATARDLADGFGERRAVLAREISKFNEQLVYAPCRDLPGLLGPELRGEITVVIEGGQEEKGAALEDMDALLRRGLDSGEHSPSRLAKMVAGQTGINRERVYNRLLELKAENGFTPDEV